MASPSPGGRPMRKSGFRLVSVCPIEQALAGHKQFWTSGRQRNTASLVREGHLRHPPIHAFCRPGQPTYIMFLGGCISTSKFVAVVPALGSHLGLDAGLDDGPNSNPAYFTTLREQFLWIAAVEVPGREVISPQNISRRCNRSIARRRSQPRCSTLPCCIQSIFPAWS